MKNTVFIVVVLIIILGGVWWYKSTRQRQSFVQEKVDSSAALAGGTITPAAEPAPTVKKNSITGSGTYAVDTTASVMKWEGRKPLLLNYVDTGIIGLKSGGLILEDSRVKSGTFTVDMASIKAEKSSNGDGETLLTGHLKSDAFFDVEKFPESVFTITTVEPVVTKEGDYVPFRFQVTGDFTMKGITNSISFPAEIYEQDGALKTHALVSLDRSKWDVRFGSGSFFSDLGDKIIDDMFTVTFDVVARQPA
ncbi:MAG TPA: lipid-binding protein [Candidatus Magasanikbacteria bacterium]|nr:lipid-binding protein [Candidatus Magasanikbacteria bacterium]